MKWLLLLAMLPGLALAEGPQLQVDAQLQPAGQVMVGSTVRLEVTVFTDTWFTAAPQLPALQIPGALVQVPGGEAEKLNKQEDGKTLFGLRYAYLITPNQAQAFAVPALTINASLGQASAPLRAQTLPLSFTAQRPPGFAPGEPVLVASGLRFSQHISRPQGELKVGDSLVRELTLEADGAQAMQLPKPPVAHVEGLSLYPAAPRIEPISDGRGSSTGGRRIDRISYRIDQPGNFTLPAIELSWWDSSSQQKRSISVPAIDFKAQNNGSYQAPFSIRADLATLGQNRRLHLSGYWLGLALFLAAWVFVYATRPWWRRLWAAAQRQRQRRREAWLNSAEYAWRQVPGQWQQQPRELSALYLWLRRRTGLRSFGDLDRPGAKPLLGLLNQHLADTPHSAAGWPVLEQALAPMHQALQTPGEPPAHALKALNPRQAKERS